MLGRTSNGTDEAGDSARRDRSHDCSRCPLPPAPAEAGYGLSAPFRQGLIRGVGLGRWYPASPQMYPVGVPLIWPIAGRGRPRKRMSRTDHPCSQQTLAHARWKIHQLAHRNEESSKPAFRRRVTRPTHHRSGSGRRVRNICRGTRPAHPANIAPRERRKTSPQPARQDGPAHARRHDQGSMDL